MANLTDEVKRAAFTLSLAIEDLIYGKEDRLAIVGFVALTAAFQNLVENSWSAHDALTLFTATLKTVTDPQFALDEDDPATRGYVMLPHKTVQ